MVATSSSHGDRWESSILASGIAASSACAMRCNRFRFAAGDVGGRRMPLVADSEEVTTEMQAQLLGRPGWLVEEVPPRRVHGRDGPGAGARCRDAARIRRWPDS